MSTPETNAAERSKARGRPSHGGQLGHAPVCDLRVVGQVQLGEESQAREERQAAISDGAASREGQLCQVQT